MFNIISSRGGKNHNEYNLHLNNQTGEPNQNIKDKFSKVKIYNKKLKN